ncbi:MAG TPA: cytochrome c biogenesis protein ResB [Candidatus Limnocylindrales bacterium]|nr:cytochrome c biogenesis protein ResB [Candidatus Limnocylindrales bacterium]
MFQISLLAIAGVIGTLLRQLPSFSLHDPAAYAQQMAEMHVVYDSLTVLGLNIGPGMVDVFERVGFFRVFSAPWFVFLLTLLVVSIIVCTLDRTPNLWRTAHNVKVVQAAPFYDLRLSERARFAGVEDGAADQLTGALRGRHFRIRQEATDTDDGGQVINVYGDRNQYFKLATLFTHLGLILFLAGGAVTVGLGYETVVFLGEGQTAPVQAVGTPDNLLVKNIHFEAPTDSEGRFTDFRTDLAVYQNGQEVARKVIRVNDPLEVNGFVFHQNTFGPAQQLQIHDPSGKLVWDGPVLLAGELADLPQGFLTIPGSDIGLVVVLHRNAAGEPLLALTGITSEAQPGGGNIAFLRSLGLGQTSEPGTTGGYAVTWNAAGAYTGMVIKKDPGQTLIWLAYLSLIIGLVLTFYFPRRRLWARMHGDHLEMAMLADRYVDVEREFSQLLDDLSTRLGKRPERRLST